MYSAPTSKTLYHYTTLVGLRGILESGHLWASDAFFLNDSEELRFGAKLLSRALEPLLLTGVSEDNYTRADGVTAQRARVATNVIEGLISDSATSSRRVFVASLCESGDLLSQWRGYGPGGYSIGIQAQGLDLLDLAEGIPKVSNTYYNLPSRSLLRKVIYGEPDGDALAHLVGMIAPDDGLSHVDRGFTTLAAIDGALQALAVVKHEAFKEEQEWRVIVIRDSSGERSVPLLFREAPNSFGIPYVELPLVLPRSRASISRVNIAGGLVTDIVVGPGGDMETRYQSLIAWLRNEGLNDIRARKSDAPFRG